MTSGGVTFSVCLGMQLRPVALQEKSQEDASPSYLMRIQKNNHLQCVPSTNSEPVGNPAFDTTELKMSLHNSCF